MRHLSKKIVFFFSFFCIKKHNNNKKKASEANMETQILQKLDEVLNRLTSLGQAFKSISYQYAH